MCDCPIEKKINSALIYYMRQILLLHAYIYLKIALNLCRVYNLLANRFEQPLNQLNVLQ